MKVTLLILATLLLASSALTGPRRLPKCQPLRRLHRVIDCAVALERGFRGAKFTRACGRRLPVRGRPMHQRLARAVLAIVENERVFQGMNAVGLQTSDVADQVMERITRRLSAVVNKGSQLCRGKRVRATYYQFFVNALHNVAQSPVLRRNVKTPA